MPMAGIVRTFQKKAPVWRWRNKAWSQRPGCSPTRGSYAGLHRFLQEQISEGVGMAASRLNGRRATTAEPLPEDVPRRLR